MGYWCFSQPRSVDACGTNRNRCLRVFAQGRNPNEVIGLMKFQMTLRMSVLQVKSYKSYKFAGLSGLAHTLQMDVWIVSCLRNRTDPEFQLSMVPFHPWSSNHTSRSGGVLNGEVDNVFAHNTSSCHTHTYDSYKIRICIWYTTQETVSTSHL